MLGIHKLRIDDHRCSYFIERPFGNYLVFTDDLKHIDSEFFRSKGGVYKQFIEDTDKLHSLQGKLFKEFGCYGVGLFDGEKYHEYLPLEAYEKDYADPLVNFKVEQGASIVYFSQKGSRVIFFGKDFYLTSSGEVLLHREPLSENITRKIEFYQPHFLFFTSFAKQSLSKLK